MNKSRFSEKQIYFILKQAEKGALISDICKVMGISVATFYNWRNKYGYSESTNRLKIEELQEENKSLKVKILELQNDRRILLEVLKKRR